MAARIIIIDVDGVLTNNIVYFDGYGERIKGFHTRDIRAIRELISRGYEVICLTQSSWPGMQEWSKRTGAVVETHRDKWAWVSKNIREPYIAVGDDTPDMETLRFAESAYCPLDADMRVKALGGNITVLQKKGGEGVIAELVTWFLK